MNKVYRNQLFTAKCWVQSSSA